MTTDAGPDRVGEGVLAAIARRSSGPFWTVVAVRVGFWAAAGAALLWSPLRSGFHTFPVYGRRSDFVFNVFAQWDSGWFLRIAQHGYDTKQAASFFPLYPLLTRGLGFVLDSDLAAAVLISLVSAGAAGMALVRLARMYAGEQVARDSVLLFALYPVGFVFTAAYADGLFVALSAWSFVFALRARVLPTAVLAAAATLTRPTGIALLPALVFLLWPRQVGARRYLGLASLLLLPAALAGYALYLRRHFGDAGAFLHSEGSFWLRHVPAAGPLGGAWDALKAGEQGLAQLLLHLPAHSGAPGGFGKPEQFAIWNVLQLVLLVATCVLTWICWKKVDRAAAIYSAATIVLFLSVPAAVVPLVSTPRFLLGDFPLFIALAVTVAQRRSLRTALVACFAAVGMLAAVGFAHGVWIS